jgi:hypothetical protein
MKIHVTKSHRSLLWSATLLIALQLSANAAILTNRYSFNETSGTNASDSISGQTATLVNGAAFDGVGNVGLVNPGVISDSSANPQYVALPPNLCSNLTAVTLEAWVTPLISSQSLWSRVWDFGDSDGTNGVVSFFYSRLGDNAGASPLADAFIANNGGDNWVFTSASMNNGVENHWVWTADPATHIAHIYLNGVVVGTSTTYSNTFTIAGSMTNYWLGRSQFRADYALDGSFNEFRIYSGALTPFEIAADYQNGADTYPASYGTVNSLQLELAPIIGIGNSAPATVLAGASALTNTALNITKNPEIAIAYSSANTNIAKVDALGNVTGLSSGTVNIIATYASVSSTQSVQIVALPTTMIHRYSFNDGTANDSIGTANGTFFNTSGNSTIANGQLNLTGTVGDYVDLGPNIINPTNIANNAISLEGWITAFPVNGAWTRAFDFGNISGNLGANYIFFAPNTAGNGGNARVAVSDTSPGYLNEAGFNVNNILGRTNMHFVVVFNPNPSSESLTLFENGVFVTSTGTGTRSLATINNVYSFLGRSLYSGVGDAWLAGSINEFRIYNGALDRFQVAASYQAGTETTNFNVGAFTSFTLNAGPLPMDLSSGRSLVAAMNFAAATNVVVIGDPNLTLTSGNTNVFTVTSPGGFIYATGVGSATLTAVYKYVTGATTTSYTNTLAVSVSKNLSQVLAHRYSFTTDLSDSIGGPAWNGTAPNGAAFANGQVVLSNSGSNFVQLPAGVISNYSALTIESWVSSDTNNGNFSFFYGFGNTDTNGLGEQYLFGSLNRAYAAITGADPGYTAEQGVFGGPGLNGRTNLHWTAVYDPPAGYIALYTNGVLAGINATVTTPLSAITCVSNYIGRSLYNGDPWPNLSVDEFRIYSGVLHADDIALTDQLGPNLTLNPIVTATASGNSITFSWATNYTGLGYTLYAAPSLVSSWSPAAGTPTTVGANTQQTVPRTGPAQFFRLRR